MDKTFIEKYVDSALEKTNLADLGPKTVGKARDVYTQPDKIIFVSTDRYSAFDRNLALIPFKGQVLTQTAKFWFDKTKHIIPNHVLDCPDPNVMVGKKATVVPVEVIVRGYITGVTATALWTLYQSGQRDFGGFTLPAGMHKNQKLDTPVITPTTKFDVHDRPLLPSEVVSQGYVEAGLWKQIEEAAIKLFIFGQELALKQGLILVDTKYEFGTTESGELILIDEVHTPDSSRFWQAASYQDRLDQGLEPENFDKEFLRLWFKEHSDPYKDDKMPDAPREMVVELASRYIQIYEQLTGQRLKVEIDQPIQQRIEQNLKDYKLK